MIITEILLPQQGQSQETSSQRQLQVEITLNQKATRNWYNKHITRKTWKKTNEKND